jgi:glutamine synthetase
MARPSRRSATAAAELRQRLQAAGVHTLLVHFADIHGTPKGKLVPLHHLDDVLATGAGFAGPSIWGTGLQRTGRFSEYFAKGVATTALPLPWMPGVARLIGDGFVDGQPFEACPRQVLRRATARLAERGWTLKTGLEPEFFLLRREGGHWVPADPDDRLDKPSYDLKSLARQMGFLQALREALEAAGLDVLQLDHEDARGQYEVNVAYDEALASADHLMTFKLAAHALAEQRGLTFSMMPKPFADQPGSGLHLHVSLWEGARNRFEDAQAGSQLPLSRLGRHFLAGLLAHAPALCALAAPTVNSYKRLIAGASRSGSTWAPASIAHGPNNRTAMVRTLPGRFEWRLPDASANPYLVTAGLIAAGLDGIDRGLEPPPAIEEDLVDLPAARRDSLHLAPLPRSLDAALDALERSDVVTAALGPTLTGQFLSLKREEWAAYASHVSDWECQRYVSAF